MAAYDETKVMPATDIGPSWTTMEVPRNTSKRKRNKNADKYFFSPIKLHRFRSRAEVNRYKTVLEDTPAGGDEDKAWEMFKGKVASGGSGGGGRGAPKSKGPSARKRKSSAGGGARRAKKKKSSSGSNKSTNSTRGYLPNVDLDSTTGDGPYFDANSIKISKVYNFPKNTPEGGDEALEGPPYCHITNWFLAKRGQDRMELPTDQLATTKLCLYGELLPSPKRVNQDIARGKEPPECLPVVIRRPSLWSIDRDHAYRGIWLGTKDAWYKLQQPCTAKVLKDKNTGEMLSQEDLHLKLRAKFGLVSNLLDMFNESSVELNLESFFGLHSCRSPNESHSLLSPSKVLLEEYPELLEEPFDLDLLRRETEFVLHHLKGCHEDFDESCLFFKGLTVMKTAMRKKRKASSKTTKEEDTFDYLTSAEAAEKRGGRLPWGCLIDVQEHAGPRINRIVEIKVQLSKSPPTNDEEEGEVEGDKEEGGTNSEGEKESTEEGKQVPVSRKPLEEDGEDAMESANDDGEVEDDDADKFNAQAKLDDADKSNAQTKLQEATSIAREDLDAAKVVGKGSAEDEKEESSDKESGDEDDSKEESGDEDDSKPAAERTQPAAKRTDEVERTDEVDPTDADEEKEADDNEEPATQVAGVSLSDIDEASGSSPARPLKRMKVDNRDSRVVKKKKKKKKKKQPNGPKTQENRWAERLEELKAHGEQTKNCNVVPKNNPELKRWMKEQRCQLRFYKEKEPSTLTEQRVEELEALGFDAYHKNRNHSWGSRFNQLRAFKDDHGHCRVPESHCKQLNVWVKTQKEMYWAMMDGRDKSSERMTPHRRAKLDALGFDWSRKRARRKRAKDSERDSSTLNLNTV